MQNTPFTTRRRVVTHSSNSALLNRRRALTLIELVVVIAILAVLGGLAVRTLPNMLKRTHLSKCADTISSLNRTWGESYALYTRYPTGYDSLLVSGGASAYDKLTPGLTALVSPSPLSASEAQALRSIGVSTVVDLASIAGDVTYNSAPLGMTPRVLAESANVATVPQPGASSSITWNTNPLGLKRHLELATGSTIKYVAFGIGPNCSAIGAGKLLQEAPVHFAADDSINPAKVYQRYLTIFALVTDSAGNATAYFESAAGNDVDGPSSAEAHIRQFHEDSAAGN